MSALRAGVCALVFDCDGTLVDSLPAHFVATRAAVRAQGGDLDADWFAARRGLSSPDLLARLAEATGHPVDVDAAVADKRRRYLDSVHRVREIEPVTALARAAHGRLPLAVASGGSRPLVEAALAVTGLAPLFDVVVCREDVPRGKPDPALFLLAADRLGLPAAGCLAYEDSDEGIAAAHAAGMPAVDVRPLLEAPLRAALVSSPGDRPAAEPEGAAG